MHLSTTYRSGPALILALVACFALATWLQPKQADQPPVIQTGSAAKQTLQPTAETAPALHKDKDTLLSAWAKAPLAFTPNLGFLDADISYMARNPSGSVFLSAQGARFVMNNVDKTSLDMEWAGAAGSVHMQGQETLPTRINYLIGNNPDHWYQNLPSFARVHYEALYPGIDLDFHSANGTPEYDFRVQPGANPKTIRLRFNNVSDAEIDAQGGLRLKVAGLWVYQSPPSSFQPDTQGHNVPISSRFTLLSEPTAEHKTAEVGFQIAAYDPARLLVIDPALIYSTYLGGHATANAQNAAAADRVYDIAVDAGGNAYVTGETNAIDFPVANASQASLGNVIDAFVAKIDPAGSQLLYATYYGGVNSDIAYSIAVDANGNAYITGETLSADLPITSPALQGSNNGRSDLFVAGFNTTGGLIYSTYFGGSHGDRGRAIDIASNGQIYVAGMSTSNDFPVSASAFQSTRADAITFDPTQRRSDAIVLVINPADSTAPLYSSYLGGINSFQSTEEAFAIAVDNTSGNFYVAGNTDALDFPIVNAGAVRPVNKADLAAPNPFNRDDGFIAKMDPTKRGPGSLLFATYFGGHDSDFINDMVIDQNNPPNIYITGKTFSIPSPTSPLLGFPVTTSAPQPNLGGIGNSDAFVAKISDLPAVTFASYIGGNLDDEGRGIDVDANGNIYVAGATRLSNPGGTLPFLLTQLNPVQAPGGRLDAFVSIYDINGNQTTFSYLGGSGDDRANAIAALGQANAYYIAGDTRSTDLPLKSSVAGSQIQSLHADGPVSSTGPIVGPLAQSEDGFVMGIGPQIDVAITNTVAQFQVNIANPIDYTLNISNLAIENAFGVAVIDTLPAGVSFVSATPSQGSCTLNKTVLSCSLGNLAPAASATVALQVTANQLGFITNTASVSAAGSDTNPANNTATSAQTEVLPTIDLAIGNTPLGSAAFGVEASYPLTVSNLGLSDASNATLSISLPNTASLNPARLSTSQGSCTANTNITPRTITCLLGNLAKGSKADISFGFTPNKLGSVRIDASVSGTETDTNRLNNTFFEVVSILPPVDLGITIDDFKTSLVPGEPTSYEVVVTNKDATAFASGAAVSVTFPPELTNISWTCVASAGATCTTSGTGNIADNVTLSKGGATATYTIKADSDPGAFVLGVTERLNVTATVSPPQGKADPTPRDNTATDTNALDPRTDASVTLVDSTDPVQTGTAFFLIATVNNAGPSSATSTLNITLPKAVNFDSVSPAGACAQDAVNPQLISCAMGSVAPGSSVAAQINLTAPDAAQAMNTQAEVVVQELETNNANNVVKEPTQVLLPQADLSVTVVDSPDPVQVTGDLSYTVTVQNNGPFNASTVISSFDLPTGMVFQSATPKGTCTATQGAVSCALGALAAGTSFNYNITATAPSAAGSAIATVNVTSAVTDPKLDNNSVRETTTITVQSSNTSVSASGKGTGGGGGFTWWTLLGMTLLGMSRLKKKKVGLILLLGSLGSTQAQAADSQQETFVLPHGWHIGVNWGSSDSAINAKTLQTSMRAKGHNVTFTSADSAQVGKQILVGYRIFDHFGVEAGYTDLGKFSMNMQINTTDEKKLLADLAQEIPRKGNGFNASLIGYMPLNSLLSLSAKVGVYRWDTSIKLTGSSGAFNNDTNTVQDMLIGIGASYHMFQHWVMAFGWERYLQNNDPRRAIDFLSAGLRYEFRRTRRDS